MRIDPHVHFRDAEQNYKETIAHGLAISKEEGVDIVFDMPNTQKPLLLKEDAVQRLKLVPKGEEWRYKMYLGATTNEEQLKEAIDAVKEMPQVIGLKMYAGKSTGDLQILEEERQKKVYSTLAANNYTGLIAVHCEKESFMTNTFDPSRPISHPQSRPNIAEIESIKDQIKFAKETGFLGTLHIAHLSCTDSIELIEAQRGKMKITCGVTPHHLLWSEEKMNEPNGLLYKMNPPLRSKRDVEGLREHLKKGRIDWIETDHAPHTVGEKLHKGYPSGYPTLYLYKKFVEETLPSWGLDDKLIEKITFSNIVKAFGLKL